MKVTLDNVGSITNGVIEIENRKINIFYGRNGIGKSTFVKALARSDLGTKPIDQEGDLKPFFKQSATPTISVADAPIENGVQMTDVIVYNRDYISSYLFQSNDIAHNSYDLIAKSQNFTDRLESINSIVKKVTAAANNDVFNELMLALTPVCEEISFKPKKDQMTASGRTKLTRSLKDGIKREIVLDSDQQCYAGFKAIEDWLDWVIKGRGFVEQTKSLVCPFCGQSMDDQCKHKIDGIALKGKSKDYLDNDKSRKMLLAVADFANENLKKDISDFCNNTNKLEDVDAKPLHDAVEALKTEVEKIRKWCNYGALTESDNDFNALKESISFSKVEPKVFDGSRVDLAVAVKDFNDSLAELDKEAEKFATEMKRLNSAKREAIRKYKDTVNNFLDVAGIPYEFIVDIEYSSNVLARLQYKNNGTTHEVDDPSKTLSFGEFNAIALCLFALEAAKSNNSLIVLDDPISSYDSEKRAAILVSLFCSESSGLCLRSKTVVILTHDFDTVVPFFKWGGLNSPQYVKGWRLIAKNNVLTEEPIDAKSIKNMAILEKKMAENCTLPFLVRAVHLRKYFQLIDGDGDEYNYLSCLTHLDEGHNSPFIKNQDGTQTPMEQNKVLQVEANLSLYLGQGNFAKWKRDIGDVASLYATYQKETSNHNKLIIARGILQSVGGDADERVVWGHITDMYHVDSEHIFGFEGQFDDVPEYIIKACDAIIASATPPAQH